MMKGSVNKNKVIKGVMYGRNSVDLTITVLTGKNEITACFVFLSVDQMEDIMGKHGLTERSCREMIYKARMQGSRDDVSIVLGRI